MSRSRPDLKFEISSPATAPRSSIDHDEVADHSQQHSLFSLSLLSTVRASSHPSMSDHAESSLPPSPRLRSGSNTPHLGNSPLLSTPKASPSSSSHATPRQRNVEDVNNGLLIGRKTTPEVATMQLPRPRPPKPDKCALLCCFYAEFDIHIGPKLRFQSPLGFMDQSLDVSVEQVNEKLRLAFQATTTTTAASNDDEENQPDASIFDSCSEYIITGHELADKTMSLSTHHLHILARPMIIADERYERNSLLFSVGFVLRRAEDPRPYQPVLAKWARALRDVEVESQFLSNTPPMQRLLDNLLISLNAQRECYLWLTPSNFVSLQLFHPPKPAGPPVFDYQVPVILSRRLVDDLAMNWVSLHVQGVDTCLQIARKAQVDLAMVRACLRVLRHHGVLALVDLFQFANRYERTGVPLDSLQEATDFCLRRGIGADSPPLQSVQLGSLEAPSSSFRAMAADFRSREEYALVKRVVAELFLSFHRDVSVGDLWIEKMQSSKEWKKAFAWIDHRRLITFGVVHKLIQRVHCFPFIVGHTVGLTGEALEIAEMMDGTHCDDELVCTFDRPLEELLEMVQGNRVSFLYASLAETPDA